MSKELEQLRKVARQTDIGYLRDDGTVETISLSDIVARMQALEAVYVAALAHGDNTPYCRCECCIEKYPREDALGRAVKVIEDADIAAKS